MNPDCLPCAGASRPTINRPVGRTVFLDKTFCPSLERIQTGARARRLWANSHRSFLFSGWSLDGRI